MGTHPIFESDFDCLTDMNDSDVSDIQSPPSKKFKQAGQKVFTEEKVHSLASESEIEKENKPNNTENAHSDVEGEMKSEELVPAEEADVVTMDAGDKTAPATPKQSARGGAATPRSGRKRTREQIEKLAAEKEKKKQEKIKEREQKRKQ